MTLSLSLCIYHHKQTQYEFFLQINLLTLSHILGYLFNSFLSLTLKDIVLLLSKHLTEPIIEEAL